MCLRINIIAAKRFQCTYEYVKLRFLEHLTVFTTDQNCQNCLFNYLNCLFACAYVAAEVATPSKPE